MSFDALVRSGVALAESLTKTLQVTVTHEAWTSAKDRYGKPVFATGVSRTCLLDDKKHNVRVGEGKTVTQIAVLTFLGSGYTVDIRDRITLPDGTTAPIFKLTGPGDPAGNRFLTQAYLGERI